jgi:hypothetical protein
MMRFPSFTRQQAWVYGPLLTALGGAALLAVPFIQVYWMSARIRSRLHPGQSMPLVLAAIEESLDAQRIPTTRCCFMTYVLTVSCEDRLWALFRDAGRDGRPAFRIHVAGSDTPLPSLPERVPPTVDEVFRFAEANARGCTVHVNPSGVVVTVGDDGRIAAIEPPRR